MSRLQRVKDPYLLAVDACKIQHFEGEDRALLHESDLETGDQNKELQRIRTFSESCDINAERISLRSKELSQISFINTEE